jgi:hypothetical protein
MANEEKHTDNDHRNDENYCSMLLCMLLKRIRNLPGIVGVNDGDFVVNPLRQPSTQGVSSPMDGIQFGIMLVPDCGYALVVGVHQITTRVVMLNLLDERLAFLLPVMALPGPVRLSFAMLFG